MASDPVIQMDYNDVLFLHQLIDKDQKIIVGDFEDGTLLQNFLEEIELPKATKFENSFMTWPLFNRWTFKTFTHTPSCLLIDYISSIDTVYLDAKYSLIDLLMVLNITNISPEIIPSALKSSFGYKILSRRASLLEKHLEDLERIDPGIVYGNNSVLFQEILEEVCTL